MIDLVTVAREFQDLCAHHGWASCLIGGLAVQRWGEPRVTRDVDATIYTGFENDAEVVADLLAQYEPRIEDAAQFALTNRVVLLKTATNVPLDIALGGLPFEQRVVERSSRFEFQPGVDLLTCSAEDLVVLKAFASRSRDWGDIEGIVTRQRRGLNWDQIETELAPLAELKDAPDIMHRLRQIREST